MKRSKLILTLFLSFFKIGAFTFGGGYAMLSLLENEFVSKRGWLTKDEFLDMLAIAESTPGPIAINSATFIGYKTAGAIGSALATLGVVLPSFIIIYVISLFLDKFLALTLVANAFRGIQACVVYLIGSVGIKMLKQLEKKPLPLIIMGAVLVCMVAFSLFAVKFSSIVYILVSGVIGIIAFYVSKKGAEEGSK
ncbi:MAG: chromate transporter [Clostridia bacterium]|nr:chromate transporter [Clostridia bacterium]